MKVTKEINNFWKWFIENESKMRPDLITDKWIQELDNLVNNLGDFSWEIRAGIEKDNLFILSPGGNIDLLKETQEIVNLAPEINSWELHYYKPEKQWDYKFSFLEESGVNKIIDSKKWEYVIYKFKDNSFDIILKADNLESFSMEDKLLAADIVLESILGEKLSLELFQDVEIVENFSDKEMNKKNAITNLKDHIFQLLPTLQY